MFSKIKKWFHSSETIFLARLETLVGFLLAVGASLDWSQLMSLDFSDGLLNNKQALAIGLIMIVKGTLLELARRRGATDL